MKRIFLILFGFVLIGLVVFALTKGQKFKKDSSPVDIQESDQEREAGCADGDCIRSPNLKDYSIYQVSSNESMILSKNFHYSVVYPNNWEVRQDYDVYDGMDESIIFSIPFDKVYYWASIGVGKNPGHKDFFDEELSKPENINFETKCGYGYRYRYNTGFLRGIANEHFLIKSDETYIRINMGYNFSSSNDLYIDMFDKLVKSLDCNI